MKIIAKKEVYYKGITYVFVVYEDNTYEIFKSQDFYKKFPNQQTGDYGNISNTDIDEIMNSRNSNEGMGIFQKIKYGTIILVILFILIRYGFFS